MPQRAVLSVCRRRSSCTKCRTGFQLVAAKDGDEALALLVEGHHFNAVFSDSVMPGRIGGINLAEIVQRRFPRTRMVLATGYSDRRVSLPGVRIVAKPYSVADIVDTLNGDRAAGDDSPIPDTAG